MTDLAHILDAAIRRLVSEAETATEYREPLVGFAAADDSRFAELRRVAEPSHLLPCPGRKLSSAKRTANQDQITRWGYLHIDMNGRARIGDSARKVVSW